MKKWVVLTARLLFLLTPMLLAGCTINFAKLPIQGASIYIGPRYGGFIKIYNNAGPDITITPFSEGDGFLTKQGDEQKIIALKFGEKLEIPFYINQNNSTVYIPLGLKVYKNGEFVGFYFYNPITVEPWVWRQKEKVITLVFGKRELKYLQSSGDEYHEWYYRNYRYRYW
ncbi:MAG: hypothetical protein Athens071426_507 [Parcubacteria group bacterium Athens0714_26]|nr:MAG: hypothetical protein Athens101426_575 [Parcubacteria group bacterium Athens1014_26]TSD02382.1 MAG: hypothetical protein Athens071426_507 [Parcubacteria group bacterium Athens0714_26]